MDSENIKITIVESKLLKLKQEENSDDESEKEELEDDELGKRQDRRSLRPNAVNPGKWKKYGKKFSSKWLSEPKLRDWLEAVPGDPSKAQCKYCQCLLRAHHRDLLKHLETSKHRGTMTTAKRSGGVITARNLSFQKLKNYPELRDWVMPVEGAPTQAFCRTCSVLLPTTLKDLKYHATTKQHRENFGMDMTANSTVEEMEYCSTPDITFNGFEEPLVVKVNTNSNSGIKTEKPEKVKSKLITQLIEEEDDTTLFCGMLAVRLKSLSSSKRMKTMLDIHRCMYSSESDSLVGEQ